MQYFDRSKSAQFLVANIATNYQANFFSPPIPIRKKKKINQKQVVFQTSETPHCHLVTNNYYQLSCSVKT